MQAARQIFAELDQIECASGTEFYAQFADCDYNNAGTSISNFVKIIEKAHFVRSHDRSVRATS